MTTYQAVTSFNPPVGVGNSKKLYSPDLFDTATGAYPKTSPPPTVTYPATAGKIPFFESAQPVTGGNGYIQVTLAGMTPGANGYVYAIFDILNAADRSYVATVEAKLSQEYGFIAAMVPVYYLADCISNIHYTDATGLNPGWDTDGGGQKSDLLPAGNYIVSFNKYSTYTQTAAVQHPPAGSGHGIAATFSVVDTGTTTTPEVNVTVTNAATVVAAFTLA